MPPITSTYKSSPASCPLCGIDLPEDRTESCPGCHAPLPAPQAAPSVPAGTNSASPALSTAKWPVLAPGGTENPVAAAPPAPGPAPTAPAPMGAPMIVPTGVPTQAGRRSARTALAAAIAGFAALIVFAALFWLFRQPAGEANRPDNQPGNLAAGVLSAGAPVAGAPLQDPAVPAANRVTPGGLAAPGAAAAAGAPGATATTGAMTRAANGLAAGGGASAVGSSLPAGAGPANAAAPAGTAPGSTDASGASPASVQIYWRFGTAEYFATHPSARRQNVPLQNGQSASFVRFDFENNGAEAIPVNPDAFTLYAEGSFVEPASASLPGLFRGAVVPPHGSVRSWLLFVKPWWDTGPERLNSNLTVSGIPGARLTLSDRYSGASPAR